MTFVKKHFKFFSSYQAPRAVRVSARHQFTLRGQRYGASVSVYALAVVVLIATTHGGMARLS